MVLCFVRVSFWFRFIYKALQTYQAHISSEHWCALSEVTFFNLLADTSGVTSRM